MAQFFFSGYAALRLQCLQQTPPRWMMDWPILLVCHNFVSEDCFLDVCLQSVTKAAHATKRRLCFFPADLWLTFLCSRHLNHVKACSWGKKFSDLPDSKNIERRLECKEARSEQSQEKKQSKERFVFPSISHFYLQELVVCFSALTYLQFGF